MKRGYKIFAACVIFLLGLGIFLYPTISSRWNAYRQSLLMQDYQQRVDSSDEADLAGELAKAEAYNASLNGTNIEQSLRDNDGKQLPEYEELLNLNGDGIMGTIEIPVIQVKLPVYHYATDDVLDKGAGHLAGSSLPVGGKGTHALISAHRGLPTARMFTDLDKLDKGDVFYLHVLGRDLAYEVDRIKTVDPENVSDLSIDRDRDYVTLITCTPYGVNTQRLLVRGHRIEIKSAEKIVQEEGHRPTAFRDPNLVATLLCVLGGAAAGVVVLAVIQVTGHRRRLKKRKNAGRNRIHNAGRRQMGHGGTVAGRRAGAPKGGEFAGGEEPCDGTFESGEFCDGISEVGEAGSEEPIEIEEPWGEER